MQTDSCLARRVERAFAGDQNAFADLVTGCQSTLYTAAMAILHHEQDALDAVQDAILTAWRKLDTLDQPAYFNTWLVRITIRTAINHSRRRKTFVPLEQPAARDTNHEEVMDIRRAMNALDDKTRLCAMLYYYEGLSVQETAKAVGILAGTVKSRLYRARKMLRSQLEEWEDE